jgi:hypothetical protein
MKKVTALLLASACALTIANSSFGMKKKLSDQEINQMMEKKFQSLSQSFSQEELNSLNEENIEKMFEMLSTISNAEAKKNWDLLHKTFNGQHNENSNPLSQLHYATDNLFAIGEANHNLSLTKKFLLNKASDLKKASDIESNK